MPVFNGVTYARIHGSTGFNPLPKGEFGRAKAPGDNRCCCPWCSKAKGVSVDNPDGVWDALATDLTSGKTWKVHYPQLHGRRRKRRDP